VENNPMNMIDPDGMQPGSYQYGFPMGSGSSGGTFGAAGFWGGAGLNAAAGVYNAWGAFSFKTPTTQNWSGLNRVQQNPVHVNPSNGAQNNANQGGDYPGQVNYHGYNVSSSALKDDLLKFSQYIGKPVNITSGDRSSARNRAAGGANASRHLFGDAADMSVIGMTNRQIAILAHQSDLFNTVIFYPVIDATGGLRPHTHVDLNPSHDNLFLIYTPVINNGVVTQNSYSPFK
jgi:hypothetical protein